jgi:hypothetical protein
VSIWPTVLPMREGHCIHAAALVAEYDFAASAQTVHSEKYLVPCKIRALMRDVFDVAGMGFLQHADHLILDGRMLCHAPPLGEQNALLEEQDCIVGATGW